MKKKGELLLSKRLGAVTLSMTTSAGSGSQDVLVRLTFTVKPWTEQRRPLKPEQASPVMPKETGISI
jgi:hypothetical protein